MATYTVTVPPHAGALVTLSAPGGTTGDLAPTGPGIGLLVSCGATGVTVTLPIAATPDGLSVASRTFALTAGQYAILPLPATVYGTGTTQVQYSNVTTVTVAAISIPLT